MTKPRINDNLGAFIRQTQGNAARNMTQALILGASEAASMTPIDSSVLINSRFMDITKDGSKIVGTAGYGAEYAAAVNDPNNPQKFRRASAEKDFLKKGFEQAEPNIRAVLMGAIRT